MQGLYHSGIRLTDIKHAPGGLERAVTALLKIVDDTLRDNAEHLAMQLMGQ